MTISHPLNETLTFRRYRSEEARSIRTQVEDVYRKSYVKAIASGDPFDSVETFMHRFDTYTASSTFDLVVAYDSAEAIGQTWGWPLGPAATTTGWWSGLLTEPEAGFTAEDGNRTFALSEIMVAENYTGKGVAHAIHNELLANRPERRATLLVEPDNPSAKQAYLHWGWVQVSQLRPRWEHAPLFDVLILPLPISAAREGKRKTP
jgi:GNAT superfamily N-acetyltransferase